MAATTPPQIFTQRFMKICLNFTAVIVFYLPIYILAHPQVHSCQASHGKCLFEIIMDQ
jgi:hypothetical protein